MYNVCLCMHDVCMRVYVSMYVFVYIAGEKLQGGAAPLRQCGAARTLPLICARSWSGGADVTV